MIDLRPKTHELNGRAPADSEHLARAGAESEPVLPGYRLHRLEVFNWGTFDGVVHTMTLEGQTSLLVGKNGGGKSTLVDALLTLLVKPGKTRNYNLAAGAKQTERSEKSYILGAFDRRSQEATNRGEVQYLRNHATHSILLACFRNRGSDKVFTLALILYLKDGASERLYCFSNDERSIARDMSGLKGIDKLAQEMKRRGFKSTTSYSEYFEWFRKLTGLKDQAMDMFNQTVAVKDIQRLNDFIRKHMLEAKPWGEKVDELFRHFKDLSDAHRELERVQAEDLPRFEERFKLRLNEKVGQEVGVLRGNLNNERSEIDARIKLLNDSLRKSAKSNRFHFVVVDEMFSRVDDANSAYALELFRKFGLQLLIVAPLDAKARVTEQFVGCYLHVFKDEESNRSQVLQMTAREFNEETSNDNLLPRKSR